MGRLLDPDDGGTEAPDVDDPVIRWKIEGVPWIRAQSNDSDASNSQDPFDKHKGGVAEIVGGEHKVDRAVTNGHPTGLRHDRVHLVLLHEGEPRAGVSEEESGVACAGYEQPLAPQIAEEHREEEGIVSPPVWRQEGACAVRRKHGSKPGVGEYGNRYEHRPGDHAEHLRMGKTDHELISATCGGSLALSVASGSPGRILHCADAAYAATAAAIERFLFSQRRGTKEEKSNLTTNEKAGGEAARSLAGAKAGGGVVTTHEGHTGAQASQPKEHQLPHSLRFHGGRPDPDGGDKKHQISPRSPPPVPGGGKKVEKDEGGEMEAQWGRTPLEGREEAARVRSIYSEERERERETRE